MSSRPKASGIKRDSSAALFSLQDTNLSKQHKDDNFPSNLTKLSRLQRYIPCSWACWVKSLDSLDQTLKFKSFLALEEEAICFKSEKAFMMRKIEKLEKKIENRATLHSDLNQTKIDLLTAKLSLADKDIRLFELQSSVKSAKTSSLAPPNQSLILHLAILRLWKTSPCMQRLS